MLINFELRMQNIRKSNIILVRLPGFAKNMPVLKSIDNQKKTFIHCLNKHFCVHNKYIRCTIVNSKLFKRISEGIYTFTRLKFSNILLHCHDTQSL